MPQDSKTPQGCAGSSAAGGSALATELDDINQRIDLACEFIESSDLNSASQCLEIAARQLQEISNTKPYQPGIQAQDAKALDSLLACDMAWHRSKVGAAETGYTLRERRIFLLGMRQSRIVVKKACAVLGADRSTPNCPAHRRRTND